MRHHPHADAVLGAALRNEPAHAYLFLGPEGVGKAQAASEFAAQLLARGSDDLEPIRRRVLARSHPDMTWVEPRGTYGILVDDIRTGIVAAAVYRPFEADRRVFVVNRADRMNIESANSLLKTLEEPPTYAHLILVADRAEMLPQTVTSRCQIVRFDRIPLDAIVREIESDDVSPTDARTAGQLAGGSLSRARFLASPQGRALRQAALDCATEAPREDGPGRPWLEAIKIAGDIGTEAAERALSEAQDVLDYLPAGRERTAGEKELAADSERERKRLTADILNLTLDLIVAALRDSYVRRVASAWTVVQGADACERARARLRRNVAAELVFESLAYEIRAAPRDAGIGCQHR